MTSDVPAELWLSHNPRLLFDGAMPNRWRGVLGAATLATLPRPVGIAVQGIGEAQRLPFIKTMMGEGLAAVRAPGSDADGLGTVLLAGDRAAFQRMVRNPPTTLPFLPALCRAFEQVIQASENPPRSLKLRTRELSLARTRVMGVLNVTPDSFSDGGRFLEPAAAVEQALAMQAEGADVIDIGGESSRPGAAATGVEEEWRRIGPVLRLLARQLEIPISVDTRKHEIAERAISEGAEMINDITGLEGDPEMPGVVARSGVGVVLMHMQGEPATMQRSPHYEDVVADVLLALRKKLALALRAGIQADRILLDPGIGFGKRAEHNLELLARLIELKSAGRALLLGCSRKSFLGRILQEGGEAHEQAPDRPARERDHGTAATTALATVAGLAMVRVHEVAPASDVIRVIEAVSRHGDAGPTDQ
jgi:dihydropteroate synthase